MVRYNPSGKFPAYLPRPFISYLDKLMQRKYAILIDAGFLKRKLGSQENPISSQKVEKFTNKLQTRPELKDLILHRIFYYDAEPLKSTKPVPLSGGKGSWDLFDFSQTPLFHANIQLLNELKKKPYFAVRLGEVNFRGWSVKQQMLKPTETIEKLEITKDSLVPNVHQKGVDMRIGLDISSLSLKQQVDVIVLVTGDSDFVPALKFARREGNQVYLFTLGHTIKNELYEHTDLCVTEGIEAISQLSD